MSELTKSLERSDLPYYHELPEMKRLELWKSAQDHLVEELQYFEGDKVYKSIDMVAADISSGELVAVEPTNGLYGIANPVRDRKQLPTCPEEGSVPYINSGSKITLDAIAYDVRTEGHQDGSFMEKLRKEGFDDFMVAVYSLTRISPYQAFIAAQGRFAVGSDGSSVVSTHERARAADIDHSGFYAVRANTNEIVALNRNAPDREFALFGRLLPSYKAILGKVIERYVQDDAIMALHEIPDGWGGYHIAFKHY